MAVPQQRRKPHVNQPNESSPMKTGDPKAARFACRSLFAAYFTDLRRAAAKPTNPSPASIMA
jgi:hypothetical protein